MARQTLSIIGVGAFGEFMLGHLAPFFDITLTDTTRDLTKLQEKYAVTIGDIKSASASEVIVLAVPVQKFEAVLEQIAPHLAPKTLVLDVASVKIKPTDLMKKILPAHVDIVGTHPLFGPQTGKNGIGGLNIVVANIRGERAAAVSAFLKNDLKLSVHAATPEEHDKELAYVQGLTHLLMKVVVALDLPKFRFTTKTYEYLEQMVEMIRYDSDELFRAIERENPFSAEAKKAFFAAARNLEEKLTRD